jgi:hypothetical protein
MNFLRLEKILSYCSSVASLGITIWIFMVIGIGKEVGVTCPPKADPLFELGLAKGGRPKCQESISLLNRSSAN